jgi:hypothetical protein
MQGTSYGISLPATSIAGPATINRTSPHATRLESATSSLIKDIQRLVHEMPPDTHPVHKSHSPARQRAFFIERPPIELDELSSIFGGEPEPIAERDGGMSRGEWSLSFRELRDNAN